MTQPAIADRLESETHWCVGRRGGKYEELLLLTRPGKSSGSGALSDATVLFRKQFDMKLESMVGTHGRRNFTFMPREDVRCFEARTDS